MEFFMTAAALALSHTLSQAQGATPRRPTASTWNSEVSEVFTDAPRYTTGFGGIDLHVIAFFLAKADGVDSIYASESDGQTHIWTVLREYCDAQVDAALDQELALRDAVKRPLASVEFHVVGRESARALRLGDRIFPS